MTAVIEESVTISASIGKVWEMFIDLSCWSGWNTVLTVVSPGEKEPIAEGKSFVCLMRPFVFGVYLKPLAIEVLTLRKVVLSGTRFGIRARHEFLFDGNEEKTTVTSKETFAGIPQALPGWIFLQRKIKQLTRSMLHDLKNAAEHSTVEQKAMFDKRTA
jgi:hypothetical protein